MPLPPCAAEPWFLQPFPVGLCLLAPGDWSCSLLPGSPLKSHFTIPGFLLLMLQVSLSLPAIFKWMGSISSVPVHLIAHC